MKNWADRGNKLTWCRGIENYVIVEADWSSIGNWANFEASGCLFANFEANMDAEPFPPVAYQEFGVYYEKHRYGDPVILYCCKEICPI